MKTIQKSRANLWPFYLVAMLIVLLAIIKQPTLRSSFELGNSKKWSELLYQINNENDNLAQDLWLFREFFSRGTIYLYKYHQFDVPQSMSGIVALPVSFEKYLLFNSNKIVSVEGFVDPKDAVFHTTDYIESMGWQEIAKSPSSQVIQSKDTSTAIIISLFDLNKASIANGHLHFDLREDSFKSANMNKKWLVVSLVQLNK